MNKTLTIKFFEAWQSPAITEKHAWLTHLAYDAHVDNGQTEAAAYTYVAFPWASAIDYIAKRYGPLEDYGPGSLRYELLVPLFDSYRPATGWGTATHTVCQHIHWQRLIPVWEAIGIQHVHCSHLVKNHEQLSRTITFYPWPLYAVNAENAFRRTGLSFKPGHDKPYLCSFVGCVENTYYRSDIRQRIRHAIKQADCQNIAFCENPTWFFWHEVFNRQAAADSLAKTAAYNRILSDSVFSLCPEGSGPNTLRLWESLAVGSIPVLFENDWIAPQLEGISWEDISITVAPDDLDRLFDILRAIPKSRILQMQLNCINAYSSFRNPLVTSFKVQSEDI